MKISKLFEEGPNHWGLRGDPYLWRELKKRFIDIEIPETPEDLQQLIEQEYQTSTGHLLSDEKLFFIERFRSYGMSSGGISPEFWVKSVVPLLVSHHQKS